MAPPPRSAVTAESKIFAISRDNLSSRCCSATSSSESSLTRAPSRRRHAPKIAQEREIAQELGSVQRFGVGSAQKKGSLALLPTATKARIGSAQTLFRCQGWRDRAGTATPVEGKRNAGKLRGGGNAEMPRFVNLEANLEMARGKSDPAPERWLLLWERSCDPGEHPRAPPPPCWRSAFAV